MASAADVDLRPQKGKVAGDAEASDVVQFISFAVGAEQYGVDIMAAREFRGWTQITHLPEQPKYVLGVLNLRGVIVPIIDLCCRFNQAMTHATPLHVVIIVQIEEQLVGLLADRVSDIISVDRQKISPVPKTGKSDRSAFLLGLVTTDDAMIALIDLPRLLACPDERSVESAGQHAA